MMTLVDGSVQTPTNTSLLTFGGIFPNPGVSFSLTELRRIRAIEVERFSQSEGKPDRHHVRFDFDSAPGTGGNDWHFYRTENLGSAKNARRVCKEMTKRIQRFIFNNRLMA
jgi:hypothetical protein